MLTIKMLIVRLETARIPAPGARWGLSVVNFSGGATVSAASRQDAILRLIPPKTANQVLQRCTQLLRPFIKNGRWGATMSKPPQSNRVGQEIQSRGRCLPADVPR